MIGDAAASLSTLCPESTNALVMSSKAAIEISYEIYVEGELELDSLAMEHDTNFIKNFYLPIFGKQFPHLSAYIGENDYKVMFV